jgi:hypothetical protein
LPPLSVTLGSPSLPAALTPSVGIFWRVSGHVVADFAAVNDAVQYGDCVTHATGHYDLWQQWQALGSKVLVATGLPKSILLTEYDEWPRGRVVYETPANRFVLYADRRLQRPDIIVALKTIFGIATANVIVKSDLHYRTSSVSWD